MDLEKIKKLIDFVGTSKVTQLTVTEGGVTVRISREDAEGRLAPVQPPQKTRQDAPSDAKQRPAAPLTPASAESGSDNYITAPSFGLFHRTPSPDAAPFIEVGDMISAGQDLFIIEAMKVFNTVKSNRGGKVIRILVNDGEDVEFGQPILELA